MKVFYTILVITLVFACHPAKQSQKSDISPAADVEKNDNKAVQTKTPESPKQEVKPEFTVQEARNVLAYFTSFQQSVAVANTLKNQNPNLKEVIIEAVADSINNKEARYSSEDITKAEKKSQYDFVYNFVGKFLADAKTPEEKKEVENIVQGVLNNKANTVKEGELKKSEEVLAYGFIYDQLKQTPFEKAEALRGFIDGIEQKKSKYSEQEIQAVQKALGNLHSTGKDVSALNKEKQKILMYFSNYQRANQLVSQLTTGGQTYIKEFFIEGAKGALKDGKNKYSQKQIDYANLIYGKNVLYNQIKAFLSSNSGKEFTLEAINDVMSGKKSKFSRADIQEDEKKLAYNSFFFRMKQAQLKTEEERKDFLQGFKDGFNRAVPKYSQDKILQSRSIVEEDSKKSQESYKKNNLDWLKVNQKKQGIKITKSGLQYKIIKLGNGKKPTSNSTVEVHYEGSLIDGKVFDSSYKRKETVSFSLQGVIVGWTEGLQLMPEGSIFEFFIPSNLAYGERANPSIPAYSTLKFKVELIKIK